MKRQKSKPETVRNRSPRPKKAKRLNHTGLRDELGFFLCGASRIAGLMHYNPPRWTNEYDKMEVRDIFQRVRNDTAELLSRANPTGFEEWAGSPLREGTAYADRLRSQIRRNIVDHERPGLYDRIWSSDRATREAATMEYNAVMDAIEQEEPRAAVHALAFVAKEVSNYLENLFVRRKTMMRSIAATFDLWPVNLGFENRNVKGMTKPIVKRTAFARKYLIELGLNCACEFPSGRESGADIPRPSPFKLAAEDLYRFLLLLKLPGNFGFVEITPWAQRLFDLPKPMTKGNCEQWWALAKVYLYERWDKEENEFKPLIDHLRLQLSSKTPYESFIKSRVIDNALKEAFIALAKE